MFGVPSVLGPGKRVCGFLIEKELKFLGETLKAPEKPFVAILGGAKVSDKLGVIDNLIDNVDRLLIGGGMANTFLAAQGIAEQDLQPQRDRIAIDELERVLASALSLIDDNCCGLRASRCWHPSDLGALGYAWLASSSRRPTKSLSGAPAAAAARMDAIMRSKIASPSPAAIQAT